MSDYRPEVSWVKPEKRRKLIIKASPCGRCPRAECDTKNCRSFQWWFKASWRELQRFLGNGRPHKEATP